MGRRYADDDDSISARWARGEVVVVGASALAREAAAQRPNYRFNAKCSRRCGSILRGRTQREADDAARKHADDRKLCVKHPDRRKR